MPSEEEVRAHDLARLRFGLALRREYLKRLAPRSELVKPYEALLKWKRERDLGEEPIEPWEI